MWVTPEEPTETAFVEAITLGLLLDVEGGESFWGFGLDGDGLYHGQAGAVVRPVEQAADVLGEALEDRFDPAVGQVAHPAGHAVLLGDPPAAITEEDALHPAGDQHSIAHHEQTVPRPGTRPPGQAWAVAGAGTGPRSGLSAAGDQVGGSLGDGQHRRGRVGVGDARHHRRVDHPQPGYPADAQL